MIPKKIHYCWFSGDKKPLSIVRCMESWKRIMPDYEIKEWNGNSFDFDSILFVKQAIEAKKWAFASDYVRLYALYTEGGIYLDTDVEVFKRFDDFLHNRFFSGIERIDGIEYLIEAAIIGAEKCDPIIAQSMDCYRNLHFILPDGTFNYLTIPRIMTPLFETIGYEQKNKTQQLEGGITIYSTDFFDNGIYKPTADVYAWHKNFGAWVPKEINRGIGYRLAKDYDCMPLYRWFEKKIHVLKKSIRKR